LLRWGISSSVRAYDPTSQRASIVKGRRVQSKLHMWEVRVSGINNVTRGAQRPGAQEAPRLAGHLPVGVTNRARAGIPAWYRVDRVRRRADDRSAEWRPTRWDAPGAGTQPPSTRPREEACGCA